MASPAQIRANRDNASRSCGPRTGQGRAISARNSRKHGLSLPVAADPALAPKVRDLAERIAGEAPSAERWAAATALAEAHVDLLRIRAVIAETHEACGPGPADVRTMLDTLRRLERYAARASARRAQARRALLAVPGREDMRTEPTGSDQDSGAPRPEDRSGLSGLEHPSAAAGGSRSPRPSRDREAGAPTKRVERTEPGATDLDAKAAGKGPQGCRSRTTRSVGERGPPPFRTEMPRQPVTNPGAVLADAILISAGRLGELLDPYGHLGPYPNSRFRRRQGQTNKDCAQLGWSERLKLGIATFYTVNGLKKPGLITTSLIKVMTIEAKQAAVGPPPPDPPPSFEFTSDLSPEEIDRRYNEAIKWRPPPVQMTVVETDDDVGELAVGEQPMEDTARPVRRPPTGHSRYSGAGWARARHAKQQIATLTRKARRRR